MDGYFHDFLHRGYEIDSFLGGGAAIGGLERKTAETAGVASGRGRERSLPASKEKVFGRQTVIFQSTARELSQEPVGRRGGEADFYLPHYYPVVVMPAFPMVYRIGPDRGGYQSFFSPSQGSVGPQGQCPRLLGGHGSR